MSKSALIDQPSAPPVSRSEIRILGLILLIGLILRVVGLNEPLWFDEITTLTEYVRLPLADLLTTYDSLNNHVFFSLQGKAAFALLGESAWALRLPAVIWGVASLWALWLLARRVVSPTEALMTTALMAVSYHHVWFSQNARGYTGLLFIGLIALVLLVDGMRRPSWRVWFGFGLTFSVAMYTHLSAAFFYLAIGLSWAMCLIVARFRDQTLPNGAVIMPLTGAALGIAVTALLYLPMYEAMITTFSAVQSGPEDVVKVQSIAQWKNPFWTLTEVIRGLGPILGPVMPIAVFVMGVAFVRLFRASPVLPLILLLHIGVTISLLVALSFRVWPRYFLTDLGLICLLLIHGATGIGDWIARRLGHGGLRLGYGLAMLGIVSTLVLLPKNYLYPKQDFTGARDFVEANRDPGARVIALGLTIPPYRDYYAPEWEGVENLSQFQALYDQDQETWIVYTFPAVTKRRHGDILDSIQDRFSKVAYFHGTLSGGGVVVLKSNSP